MANIEHFLSDLANKLDKQEDRLGVLACLPCLMSWQAKGERPYARPVLKVLLETQELRTHGKN